MRGTKDQSDPTALYASPPPLKCRSSVARALSYTIFVSIAAWKLFLSSNDATQTPLVFYGTIDGDDSNNTSFTKVLIARTVSPSEIPIVVEDLMHVKSFYTGQHEELKRKSRAHCGALKEAGWAASLDPHLNGTRYFPNHILCNADADAMENNYWTVRADFMLFARSDEHARNISKEIDLLSSEIRQNSLYDLGIDVKDVSGNPKKIWNWILHCTDDRLAGYDYVWFIDGDMSLKSLNWQAFWQQVKMMRPKITQASVIGSSREGHATVHSVLRYVPDSRVMAAETSIIEVQSPLLEARTWLDYRDLLVNDPLPMEHIEDGGEACFDMGWCHLAKNNMTGVMNVGVIRRVAYHHWSPTLALEDDANADAKGRGCVVLYQSPIMHLSKHTIVTSGRFVRASELLCKYFRLKLGAIGKTGLKNLYDIWNAPKI